MLFKLEYVLVKLLLKFLIGIIYAKLLEAIYLIRWKYRVNKYLEHIAKIVVKCLKKRILTSKDSKP